MPQIQVRLNVPRHELLAQGWEVERLGGAFKFCEVGADKFESCKPPDDFWQEPNTGALLLRPSYLSADYDESEFYQGYRILSSNMEKARIYAGGGPVVKELPSGALVTLRNDPYLWQPLTAAVAATQALLDQYSGKLVWTMRTHDPLAPNEGWAAEIQPYGVHTDRAGIYLGFHFGHIFFLAIHMNGTAVLWENTGTQDDPKWIDRALFTFRQGGVDHTLPFQVGVVPFGFDKISFTFSNTPQAAPPGIYLAHFMAGAGNPSVSYLYEGRRYKEDEFDSVSNQWIKTKSAKLHVAMRLSKHQYLLRLSRIRYPQSAVCRLGPELLKELRTDTDPVVEMKGFEGMALPGQTPADVSWITIGKNGYEFDNEIDTEAAIELTLTSSGDRMYTPEVWRYSMGIPPLSFTPDWTPIDISPNWTVIRFQRTVVFDVSVCEIKYERQADFPKLFKLNGTVEVKVGDDVVFEGYVERSQPVLEGPQAIIVNQLECRDLWVRLNETPVDEFASLDGKPVLDTIKKILAYAGFTEEEDIEVSDPDDILAEMVFGSSNEQSDLKQFDTDATAGEALRWILDQYQSKLRVRRVGGKWKIYLAPVYEFDPEDPDPEKLPTKRLILHSSLFTLVDDAFPTDAERWENHEYKCLSNPEFTVLHQDFNSLEVRAVGGYRDITGGGNVTSGIVTTIYDKDSYEDPDYIDFVGRVIPKHEGPQNITATSQEELNGIARNKWDGRSFARRPLEVRGEWQPEIDADDFFWVIGIDDAGNRVSYGAYRIQTADIEIRQDHDVSGLPIGRQSTSGWDWQASYSLIYAGQAFDDDTPMFTETLP